MNDINRNLKIITLLTTIIFLMEFLGGTIANSLALISDAAHVLTDVVALALAYGAMKISTRPSTRDVTFGYHRFEIFAAMINGLTIIGIAVLIFFEAYDRILSPPPVKGIQVLVIAAIGLIVNTYAALKLHGYHELHIKGAYLHVLGDALASIAVIIGAVVIILTGETIVDPVLSVLIGLLLIYGAIKLVYSSARILLEFAPEHADADTVANAIMEVEGIKGTHDMHIWSISSNIHAMSAHILVDRIYVQQTEALIQKINRILRDRFNILHTTLQFECAECEPAEIMHTYMHTNHYHE